MAERPIRTCVGCRVAAAKSDLLRLVVRGGSVIPDPHRRLPGRGAALHPDLGCFELAVRRRAFSRAYRVRGPLDLSELRQWLEQGGLEQRTAGRSESDV